jgi:hypothetical protein
VTTLIDNRPVRYRATRTWKIAVVTLSAYLVVTYWIWAAARPSFDYLKFASSSDSGVSVFTKYVHDHDNWIAYGRALLLAPLLILIVSFIILIVKLIGNPKWVEGLPAPVPAFPAD